MTTWTFIWLMVLLKIPIAALFVLVRWAIGQTPEIAPGEDGGIGRQPGPRHPHRPRSRPPHAFHPRRGAHGERSPSSPARVRSAAARARLPRS